MLNVQLKLQSGPRLEQVNNKKKEFTVLWEGFREKVCCACVHACRGGI